ncbi:MAG: MFS transporter [Bacillota bacterium]
MSDLNLNTRQEEQYKQKPIFLNKNYMLLTIGSFVSGMGDSIHGMALTLFVIAIAGDASIAKLGGVLGTGTALSIVVLISYLPSIGLGPLLGVLVDRYDRRKIMIWMDVFRGFITVALGYLAYMDMAPLWVLCAATALLVSCSVFYFPAVSALYPNLVHESQLVKANSISSFVGSTTGLLGPILAPIIYKLYGAPGAFAINGLTFFFSAFCEIIMTTPKVQSKGNITVKTFFSNLLGGLKFVIHTKALLAMLLFGLSVNFFFFPIQDVVHPIIIKKTLSLTDNNFGFINAMFIAGFMASAVFLNFLPKMDKKHKFMIWSMFTQALGLMLLVVPIYPMLAGKFNAGEFFMIYCSIAALRGLAFGFSNVPMRVVYQTLIPDEYRGRVYSLQGMFFQLAKPIGVAIAGPLIDIFPIHSVTTIAGLGMAIACFVMFTVKEIKEV